ncbi:MAG: hypothetical protein BJ554DRAFT_4690, partial [Olpidium bornovanus]
ERSAAVTAARRPRSASAAVTRSSSRRRTPFPLAVHRRAPPFIAGAASPPSRVTESAVVTAACFTVIESASVTAVFLVAAPRFVTAAPRSSRPSPLEAVEADIQKLTARNFELLDKDEKELTRREKAELDRYDRLLALSRHWQAEMSKASGPNLKAFRQQRYKRMSVGASCRKYLDALAQRLANFYAFDWAHRQAPTIGDVEDWHYNTNPNTHTVLEPDGFQSVVRKGTPLLDIPLPQLYTPDEWTNISKFNYKTTERIHNTTLPMDSRGRQYVVVYHEDFTEEMRTFLQTISVRATGQPYSLVQANCKSKMNWSFRREKALLVDELLREVTNDLRNCSHSCCLC